MKRADVGGAVAEEAHHDILLLVVFDRPPATGSEWKMPAHDPVTTHEAEVGVEHVHRAATTV